MFRDPIKYKTFHGTSTFSLSSFLSTLSVLHSSSIPWGAVESLIVCDDFRESDVSFINYRVTNFLSGDLRFLVVKPPPWLSAEITIKLQYPSCYCSSTLTTTISLSTSFSSSLSQLPRVPKCPPANRKVITSIKRPPWSAGTQQSPFYESPIKTRVPADRWPAHCLGATVGDGSPCRTGSGVAVREQMFPVNFPFVSLPPFYRLFLWVGSF